MRGRNVITDTAWRKKCLKMESKVLFGNRSHVAFLQLGDFPLQLLVVCIAGSHPGEDNRARKESREFVSVPQKVVH